jgi:hypothetical protein
MINNFVAINVAAIGELVYCSLFIIQKIECLFFIIGNISLWLFDLIMYIMFHLLATR